MPEATRAFDFVESDRAVAVGDLENLPACGADLGGHGLAVMVTSALAKRAARRATPNAWTPASEMAPS